MDKPKQMDEDALNAYLDNELSQCIGFNRGDDEIAEERRKNLNMYLNRPVGDEEIGRSQMQDSTIQDVVETLLPSTLAPFISADTVFEFKPVSEEDEEQSEQRSKYTNHIMMSDNDGVGLQYKWQKDALLQKNGFVYVDWVEKEKTARKLQRVDYAGLVTFAEDDEIEILEYAGFMPNGEAIDAELLEPLMENPEAYPQLLEMEFEVDYRRSWKEGRVKIDNIAPENVIVSASGQSVDEARLIGWFGETSISDLREEGYSEDLLKKLEEGADLADDAEGERIARTRAQGGLLNSQQTSTDPASRRVWRAVMYTNVDFDGDGKAELRRIIRAGHKQDKGGVILSNEEADEKQMVDFTPIIMPHQLFGRCPADQAREIQEGKTFALRMANDIIAQTAHPRYKYKESSASDDTWDDLMTDIPGHPVRLNELDAVDPLRDAPDLGPVYQQLDYFDRMREVRTPVTRQDQGVNADILNDKTAREATIQANATAMKKELILRLYARSLSKLAKMINRLVIKHQDKPRLVRLYPNKPPVEIDPRFWDAEMDLSVNVGLGTGTKDQQMAALMNIHQIQMGDRQLGLPTVDDGRLYNTRARLVEYSGLSSPEMYFNDPENEEQGVPRSEVARIVQQEKAAAFEEGKQASSDELKVLEIQTDKEMHDQEIALEREELAIRQSENMAQAAGLNV